jgi:AcrR family transcriptional regulator
LAPRTEEQFEVIREARKGEILDAAFHLFAEEGYHGASVSKIAAKAGISKGLMYNYFKIKEDVLRAIMRDILHFVEGRLEFVKEGEFTEEKLFKWVDGQLDIVTDDPKRWRLYMALSVQPDVTPIMMEEASGNIETVMKKFTEFFISKGVEDPMFWLRQINAYIDGIQMHLLLDPQSYPKEKARKEVKRYIQSLYQ